MNGDEQRHAKPNPPYIDESLVINSRLSKIERKQSEESAERRKHERSQRLSNWTMAIFTALLFLTITSTVSDAILMRQTTIGIDSANAAKRAADTASKTLDQTIKAGVVQKRQLISLIISIPSSDSSFPDGNNSTGFPLG